MPDPISAIAGGSVISGIMGGRSERKAAKSAAGAQQAAAEAAIEEQRRQFEYAQKMLSPYMQGGESAYGQQQVLAGAMGPEAQQRAIAQLQANPQFLAMLQQGENAMLQNASATGGLRGGNLQGALAQFRPQMLNQMIEQQYSRLGGLSNAGLSAAGALVGAGRDMANAVGQGLTNIGQSQAGYQLARGQSQANMWNMLPQVAGMFAGGFSKPPAGTLTSQLNAIDTQYGISTPAQQYGSGMYNLNLGGNIMGTDF